MKVERSLPFRDVVTVEDAPTIRALVADERIDREFRLHGTLNRSLIKRALRSLSYEGTRFPHMTMERDPARSSRHAELWNVFNAHAPAMSEGPEELEPIAQWIRHGNPDQDPGVLAQQVIGSFFDPGFRATPESWEAAVAFHEDATTTSLSRMLWWGITRKGYRAKKRLASLVNNDIVAMHGTGVAVHNLVASIHGLRALYDDATNRHGLTPQAAVDLSLKAPPVVLRQASSKGVVAGCPFSKFTLFKLRLRDADRDDGAKDLIFMTNAWSRCPAEQWIPAVIAGTWKRVMLAEQRAT